MGRYYDTDGGREGKFMFGVQASDDPGYLGMHEQEPSTIEYYADTDDTEDIKAKLDEQYNILGVPDDKRIYYWKDDKEAQEFDDYVDFEIEGNALALARIRLALDILSDIKDNGYCSLNAEI